MIGVLALWGCGLAAGFVNGLLGTGGGILLIFGLNKLLKNIDAKDIYALTLTVTLVLSLISVGFYIRKGGFSWEEGIKYGAAAIPGGIAGAFLLDRLKSDTVKKMFAFLLIFAGMNMANIF